VVPVMKCVDKVIEKKLINNINLKMYTEGGIVNCDVLRESLKISTKLLAQSVGRTPRTLQKNPESEAVQLGLRKIAYLYKLLEEMLGSEKKALIWLKAPNSEFGGLSPVDIIAKGEMDIVIDYLMDVRKGALV